MLTFIGLGLFDKTDVSEKGLRQIRAADCIFLEYYTSRLMGTTLEELEDYYRMPITPLFRQDVEQTPEVLLSEAES